MGVGCRIAPPAPIQRVPPGPTFQHVGVSVPRQRVGVRAPPQVLDPRQCVARSVVVVRGHLCPGPRQVHPHAPRRMGVGCHIAPGASGQRVRPAPAFQHVGPGVTSQDVGVSVPRQRVGVRAPPQVLDAVKPILGRIVVGGCCPRLRAGLRQVHRHTPRRMFVGRRVAPAAPSDHVRSASAFQHVVATATQ